MKMVVVTIGCTMVDTMPDGARSQQCRVHVSSLFQQLVHCHDEATLPLLRLLLDLR